jgi:glycosyltransferase involved in cell wall biosynthesis
MKRNIGIAAVGDVTDINTWSNIPYFFYTTGASQSLFNEPWKLDISKFKFRRPLWNLKKVFSGQGIGGYQYSTEFLDKAEQQIPDAFFSSTVISFNQLFPRASTVRKAGGRIFYYIDSTLFDLFSTPQYAIKVPDEVKAFAIDQERQNYLYADKVVSMGQWVHASLAGQYSLPDDKVGHILPGANVILPDGFSISPYRGGAGTSRDLRLGFVGKDWKRKGLPLLMEIRNRISELGLKVKIVVLGNAPSELSNNAHVEFSGFIDKQREPSRFVDAISSCDLGCLFSSAEALGISTLEFLRVGTPVTGFYHQGLRDTLLEGASLRFNITDDVDTIARRLVRVVSDEQAFKTLKEQAMAKSDQVTWEACVQKWKKMVE